mgnify:CR=1 FL=1
MKAKENKFVVLVLVIALILPALINYIHYMSYAQEIGDYESIYEKLKEKAPELINELLNTEAKATEDDIKAFIQEFQSEMEKMYNAGELNRNNFKEKATNCALELFNTGNHFVLFTAIVEAFPDELADLSSGEIPDKFEPLISLVKESIPLFQTTPTPEPEEEITPTPTPTPKPKSSGSDKITISKATPTPTPTPTPTATPTPTPSNEPTPTPVSSDTVEPEIKVEFNDLQTVEWAKESIYNLAGKGILVGTREGYFEPDSQVTREQFVKILVMAFEFNDNEADIEFKDVEKDSWYAPYLANACYYELVKGKEDGTFGVGEFITREDMAVMALRVAEKKGIVLPEVKEEINFVDGSLISDYAKPAVTAMQKAGIINGLENNSFAPKDFATRAQAAKIVDLLLKAGQK